jgi:hypothetical protein
MTCLEERLAQPRQTRPLPALEPPTDHHDVTTIMGLLGDIQHDVAWIRRLLEDEDGQEKLPKMTPEEIAQRELHQPWVRERIEYHEANAREQEARPREQK